MTIHHYLTDLSWTGSTGAGYRDYSRDHSGGAPATPATIELSADPHFRGDAARLNPEQLLVMAASSCQLLSFLGAAARRGVDVVGYVDSAVGVMDDRDLPARIGSIRLAPIVTVAPGTDHAFVRELLEVAHSGCFIANSLTSTVTLEPTIVERAPRERAISVASG